MKKYVVMLMVLCCVGMATADVVYDVDADWVAYPDSSSVWSFGSRNMVLTGDAGEATSYDSGVFEDFVPMTHVADLWGGGVPNGDAWVDESSAGNTCSIWKFEPWTAFNDTGMMVWVNHGPVVRLTPVAGEAHIVGNFIGVGYANPIGISHVYVAKNGDYANPLADGYVFDKTPSNGVMFDITTTIAAGDYLEFMVASAEGAPETRAALDAVVTVVVPEPATMIMLGLGGLSLLKRKK